MRESSGGEDIGRDTSANNVTADTAEAGTWQQSWNSRIASPELPKLLRAYQDTQPSDVDAIFMTGVTLRAGSMESYGTGDGRAFQDLAKARPSFAVLAAALALRTLYIHFGPIVRREAEIVPAADALFREVQAIVDAQPRTAPQFQATQGSAIMADTPEQQPAPTPQPAALPATVQASPMIDLAAGIPYILQFRDKARKDLTTLVTFFNSAHPDIAIGTPATIAPAPAPSTGSLLDRPSVQLGGVGLAATGILHTLGALDPNMAILAAIVSIATAALGPAGGVVGNVIMSIARAAWNASQASKPQ
jgi:hypothetical protein